MAYTPVTATRKIFGMQKRIRAVSGGTAASKTISITFWIIDWCQTHGPVKPKDWPDGTPFEIGPPQKVDIVSESYPHLEDGVISDFQAIMKERGYWDDNRWNDTKHVYTFETGTRLKFMSIDRIGKAHGPRRDILYVNECNNLDYKIVDQLITRTRKIVWLDWNPSEEFWYYTEMRPNRDDIEEVVVTYLDNEALDAITIAEIESHRHNKMWWQVYGLGQLGEVEGRIYTDWNVTLEDIPHEARLERRGLDFGYSYDPAAIVDVYYYNGGYILDERLYQKGMSNAALATYVKNMDHPNTLVFADSAEPKSIDEMLAYGANVMPAQKGPGSLNQGINYMQGLRISVTRRSVNLIKEYRKYMWKIDKNDRITTDPEPGDDHLLDATRYALESLRPRQEKTKVHRTGNLASMWR